MTHEDKFSRNPRAPRKLVPSETRFLLTSTGAGAGAGSQLPPSRSLTPLANDSALLSLSLREFDVDFETFLRRFVWSIEALLANMWKIHGVPRAVAQQLRIRFLPDLASGSSRVLSRDLAPAYKNAIAGSRAGSGKGPNPGVLWLVRKVSLRAEIKPGEPTFVGGGDNTLGGMQTWKTAI